MTRRTTFSETLTGVTMSPGARSAAFVQPPSDPRLRAAHTDSGP